MKIFVLCLCLLTLGACANQRGVDTKKAQTAAVESEAEYGGKCAMSMCKKSDKAGDERYSVDYRGKHYIFSSPEARDNFVSEIDSNIKKADEQWAGTFSNRVK